MAKNNKSPIKNNKPDNKSIKLMTIYHKKDILFKNSFIEPIHVGREIAKDRMDKDMYSYMTENMIGDNTGDNISKKNMSYNEMTAVYWCWKNYDKLGSPDYIGFMHYRRHFMLKEKERAYYECNNVKDVDSYLSEQLNLSEDRLRAILKDNDFIITKPYWKDSVYEHYKAAHHIEDLDLALRILKEKYPEFADSADKYINGHYAFFCNMFVMPKDIFFDYCSWIFSILEEYENRTDITGKRLFISERLTGIYFRYLMDSGKKAACYPTMYIEENITIPVIFATDYNYLLPTGVAVTSMLENAKETTFYDIYIMVSENIYDTADKSFESIRQRYKNCKITIVNMKEYFSDVSINIKHTTYQTYFRLMIPRLLDYNKCLYLDSDIVVTGDLTIFYRTNIDEYYIAGVKAAGYYYPESKVPAYLEKTGLESIDQYVNAGMTLMNLKRIREDKIDEKWISYVDKGLPSQDQDILNLVCYNNIKILPYKYNTMTKYLSNASGKITANEIAEFVYNEKEIKEAIDNPLIIHYADKIKPWDNSTVVWSDIWNKYKNICPMVTSKISVIIPVYNMQEYLTESLDSVFGQTLTDITVICVNDGSTDDSEKILADYKQKHGNMIVINQKNMGVAYARNRALDVACSEFICFLDPDDYYPSSDILETLYTAAKNNNAKICGGSWSELVDGKTKYEFGSKNSKYVFDKEGFIKYSDYQFDFGYQRFVISQELINNCKFRFPLYSRFQDPPFFAKCMLAAGEFYAVPKVVYCYRLGHQTATILQGKKARDFLMGITDVLRISERNNLVDLHYLCYERLNKDYRKRIASFIRHNPDHYLFELLIRANSTINRKMLSSKYKNVNENTMIEPLKDVANQYYEAIDNWSECKKIIARQNEELERKQQEIDYLNYCLSETRKSFSYKFGMFFTWIPRKIRTLFKEKK